MDRPKLELDIYQISDDALLHENRTDGTGWAWGWADFQRDWMETSPNKFAYRCLPLTIANQTGWWIGNPVSFTAIWDGGPGPGSVGFIFDNAGDTWRSWISDQFGMGIITWNTPFLFKTKPEGSRLLVMGPVNQFRRGAQPLTALIESDWMNMSFTMNWKLLTPHEPVRFEFGEPLFQIMPLVSNLCLDLEEATVRYRRLGDVPEVNEAYQQWSESRRMFHKQKRAGEVKPDGWQKDYFKGHDMEGRPAAGSGHRTKVNPPEVQDLRTNVQPAK